MRKSRFTEGKTTWTKTHRRWLARTRDQLDGAMRTALATELEHLEYLETQREVLDDETIRTARSLTSGEYLFLLLITPSSHKMESPAIPGRFNQTGRVSWCAADGGATARLGFRSLRD